MLRSTGPWWCSMMALMLVGCPGGGGGGGDASDRPDTAYADSTTGDAGPDASPEADGSPTDVGPGADGSPTDAGPHIDGSPTDAGPDIDGSPPDAAPDTGCVEDCGGSPRIITFDANVRALTEGGQVVLSAVVTDPDGVDDLLGGVLESPGGAPYGPFIAAGEAGTYGFTLTWDDLHMVQPIAFDGEAARPVVAAFFDQAGNRTTATIELTLHCREAGGAACAGACVSLDSLDHCGACDAACDTACRDRTCACPGELSRCDDACLDLDADLDNCGVCGRVCPGLPDGAPICVRGDCRIQCAEGLRLCGQAEQVCAPCPAEGVASTTCEGLTCVARTCAEGHRLCDGGCAACPFDDAQATTCLGDRCVALECPQDTHPCTEGCCPWRSVAVGDLGQSYAFTVDGQGPHIAVSTDDGVSYYRRVDGAWVDEAVVVFEAPERTPSDVAVAGIDGALHLAYTVWVDERPAGELTGRIGYLVGDADGWREVFGADDAGPLAAPALALDDGAVWLVWRTGDAIWLLDAARPGAMPEMMLQRILIADPHMALGADGAVHVVTGRNTGGDLRYVRRAPGGEIEEIDAEDRGLGGESARIVLDRLGHPVIIHRSRLDEMYLTRYDGLRWSTGRILQGYEIAGDVDLTVGVDGRPLGCAGTQLGLVVFDETDGDWQVREVANGFHRKCRIVVAPDGGHHVLASGPQGLTWYH